MSGGSYDYIGSKLSQVYLSDVETNPRRMAFQKLLLLVSKALHDIEWVDSCDAAKGDENDAIDAVFKFLTLDSETIIKAKSYDEFKEIVVKFTSI